MNNMFSTFSSMFSLIIFAIFGLTLDNSKCILTPKELYSCFGVNWSSIRLGVFKDKPNIHKS